jgi:FkbM family methyltransferase
VPPLKCFIAANVYGTYCVPASSRHRPAAETILRGDVWEAETLALMTSHCGSGDIVHAGTYFGDFLPALAKAVAPGALIWAFEPSSQNFRCAEITLRLNAIGNVRLSQAALGAAVSEALLRIGADGSRSAGGSSTIEAARRGGFRYETVRVTPLDAIVPADRMVSVLQLDVEKYEQQALAGALATIRRCLPLLVLENLPADRAWFDENIMALGYVAAGKVDANRIYRPTGATQPDPTKAGTAEQASQQRPRDRSCAAHRARSRGASEGS